MEGQKSKENDEKQVAVLIVPFPAQGHLNQLLHLSHLLTSYNNIQVHYAGSSVHNHQVKLRLSGHGSKSLTNIHFHDFDLPVPNDSDLPIPNSNTPTSHPSAPHFPAHLYPLFTASVLLRQPVSQLLHQLSPMYRRVVVIHDNIMGFVAQDVKSISNAEAYSFVPSSAFTMSVGVWEILPSKPFHLDFDVPLSEIPSFDGCFTQEVMDFVSYQYQNFLDFQCGTIYNTCRLFEGKYLQLLERLSVDINHKFFAIGPLNPVKITETKNDEEVQGNKCLDWLDKQEQDSVIFVSFGSTTTMSSEQIAELAEGLDRSRVKFIWVVRKADGFGEDVKDPELPEGYEDKVKDRGMVVRNWGPQLEILSHSSVGGFMTHCGWNSCIESISMGVPMVAWPMHSDQPRNSILVTKVLKVGIMIRDWANRMDLVRSNCIEDIVRRLMVYEEGVEVRKRAVQLGEEVRGSVANGGASNTEMKSFIHHITRW